MVRIPAWLRKGPLFFFILFILLFLGETKQPAVDVVSAGGIIAIVLYAKYYLEKQRELSRTQTIAWTGLLLYFMVRSVFSDDIGYSVYATVRYLEGFLLYRTFYCYFGQKDIKPFIHQLMAFSVISLFTAVIWTCFPFLQNPVPHMNLLYPAYGHNHIVDILLFGFPAAVLLAIHTAKTQYKIIALLLLFGIIFSMSRAAMGLIGIFLVFLFTVYTVTKKMNQKYMLFIILFGLLAAGIITTWYTVENNLLSGTGFLLRKSSVFLDSRYGYYQQAFNAIRERPFFGSGPGTFYLESLRLQKIPQTYSWFAHNFYMEQLVELGIAGCMILLFILGCIIRRIIRVLKTGKGTIYTVALVVGTTVSLIYGFFDISMNFVVIWFLCWACLGIAGTADALPHKEKQNNIISVLSVASLILIGVFYCVVISSYIIPKGLYTGFLDVYYAVDLIKNETDANLIRTAVLFHPKNPDVLLAAKLYGRAYDANPQNTSLFKDYYASLVKSGNIDELTNVFRNIISTTMSDSVLKDTVLAEIDLTTVSLLNTEQGVSFFGVPRTIKEGLSKMLYYTGLHMISQNPQTTGIFWETAKEISPELGHYYLELSALYYSEGNDGKARQILLDCQKFRYPKKQCIEAPWPPSYPGSLQDKIQSFPAD